MRDVARVGVAGAIGGLVWWLMELRLGAPPFISPWIAPLASAIVGAVAGFVFVFVVANTDRSDEKRLMGVALAAGIAWQPSLDAGQAVVTKTRDDLQVAAATVAADKAVALAQVASARPDDLEAQRALEAQLEEVATAAESVDSVRAIRSIEEAARPAIEAAEPIARRDREIHEKLRRITKDLPF